MRIPYDQLQQCILVYEDYAFAFTKQGVAVKLLKIETMEKHADGARHADVSCLSLSLNLEVVQVQQSLQTQPYSE
jgi:hypothetical protein